MKKMILFAACIMMLAACDQKATKEDSSVHAERDSLVQIINQKDGELNDIMSTFNDIQQGFREINEAEGRVNLEKANPEKSSKKDIMENISFIRRTMQLNKELIARLKQQLKSSSFNATKLQETIDNLSNELEQKQAQIEKLNAELAAKDIHIAEQDKQISSLNTNVTSLSQENESKAKTMAAQEQQLNTAWYVFGTKKELKEQKILLQGDVLKSNTFNKDYFTKIDIRVDKVIKLYSKSAKLLTSHPAGSYSLEKDTQGQYTLRITNPTLFWSVSRYLVIIVK